MKMKKTRKRENKNYNRPWHEYTRSYKHKDTKDLCYTYDIIMSILSYAFPKKKVFPPSSATPARQDGNYP